MSIADQLERDVRAAAERATHTTRGAACLLALDAPRHGVAVRISEGRLARDGEAPATPDTPFRIASITKTFTAVAVVQLASEGRIDLDDPAVDHL
jgi:CubicO group peptidase (beta-lactamase class C family)